jgi:predicted branched-subunit amino acid permease
MGIALWSTWSLGMGVGVLVGSGLPDSIGLEWVGTFMLVGLVALNLGDRLVVLAASTGVAVALVGASLLASFVPAVAAVVAVAIAAATSTKPEAEEALP